MFLKWFLSLVLFSTMILHAFNNFDISKKWLIKEVYNTPELMKDFYCKQPFGKIIQDGKDVLVPLKYSPIAPITKAGKLNIRAERIEWEHIVPAEKFGKQLKECRNPLGNFIGRESCRKVSDKFKKMEADPMNLVPAIGEINADRSNYAFSSENPIKNSKYKKCGIHIDKNTRKIHIPNRIKGKVARAYLYMEKTYDMKLSKQEKKLFQAWDKKYPMTRQEKIIRSRKFATIKKFNKRIGRISKVFTSNNIYKDTKIKSWKDYQKIAKSINKKAIAAPTLLTKESKLVMSLKGGAYTGIAVLGIEGGMAYYDFLKGNIYRREFNQKIIESSIKGTAIGSSEALVMFLMPTPHGLVLLGAGMGAYIIVDKAINTYKYYKEKHFLNASDLAAYGIEMDSVLDIKIDSVLEIETDSILDIPVDSVLDY